MVNVKMKKCTQCQKEYPAEKEYFHSHKGRKDGLNNICKSCKSIQAAKYYEENAEHVKEYVLNHYEKNKARIRAEQAVYYQENRDHLIWVQRRYAEENPDLIKQQKKKDYLKRRPQILVKLRQERIKNGEEVRRRDRERHAANPELTRLKRQRRVARKRSLPATMTLADWKNTKAWWQDRCAYCGIHTHKLTLDHFIPLAHQDCPGTIPTNIVPACSSCNPSKCDSLPQTWLAWKFGENQAETVLLQIETYFASFKNIP